MTHSDRATPDTAELTIDSAVADESHGSAPVLEADDVTKAYPGEPPVLALRGVTVTVHQGELVAVVGPSGSGKTTLLQLMGTLDRPSGGAVRVAGLNVAEMTDRELATLRATEVGFVFQQFFLAEHATVLENVADGLLYAGVAPGERRHRALVTLERVGLGRRADARPTQLSGGERQRVAIARAVVGQPAIVLADEPTGNLDLNAGREVMRLLEDLHDEGRTILLVTHDDAIAAYASREILLRDGAIASDRSGPSKPLHPTVGGAV
jgi:putative ABC transport system ATP-binding protein